MINTPCDAGCSIEGVDGNCTRVFISGKACSGPFKIKNILMPDPFTKTRFFGIASEQDGTAYSLKVYNVKDEAVDKSKLQIIAHRRGLALNVVEVLHTDTEVGILMEYPGLSYAQEVLASLQDASANDTPSEIGKKILANPAALTIAKERLRQSAMALNGALKDLHRNKLVIGNAKLSNVTSNSNFKTVFIDYSEASITHKKTGEEVEPDTGVRVPKYTAVKSPIYDNINMIEQFFIFIRDVFGTDILSDESITDIFNTVSIMPSVSYNLRMKVFKTQPTRRPDAPYCQTVPGQYPSTYKVPENFNCLTLPLRDVKFILGPCSFHHFKYGTRNIYLFGERHAPLTRLVQGVMTPGNTLLFSSFIQSLVTENSKVNYDLMFESSYFLSKYGQKPDDITTLKSPTFSMISSQFHDCIDPLLRQSCQYKNLRTHYVDYRQLKPEFQEVKAFKGYVSGIGFFGGEERYNEHVQSLFKSPRILKQITAINNADVVKKLELYVNDTLAALYTDIASSERMEELLFTALVMDIYGIARALRSFDTKDRAPGIQFSGTSDNVIYYAGDRHIQHMVKFFKDYLNLPLIASTESRDSKTHNSFVYVNISKTSFIENGNSQPYTEDQAYRGINSKQVEDPDKSRGWREWLKLW